ncbi:hypothetical protein ACFV0R_25630 [Streptomyces sp. NPDC059578]|uniref:hypothetical protein n=1 Tax=Streptomyces sp. NPDC059578 TaxID=3346874 RepID=UPI0036AD5A06
MRSTQIEAAAAYDTDWHIYIDCPDQGSLGYCIGIDPEEPFSPEVATAYLATEGWRVIGEWTPTPQEHEYPFVAQVEAIQE